ncbi:MAG: hypothetical protein ACOCQY_05060 [Halorhabdus sp.]
MSMDFSKPEEQTGAKNHWTKQTLRAVDDIIEHRASNVPDELMHCKPYDVEPSVVVYNRLVQRLARRIRSKRKALGAKMVENGSLDPENSLWCQTVATVALPPDGEEIEISQQSINVHGEVSLGDPLQRVEWEPQPVRLDCLDWWAGKQVTAQLVMHDGRDETPVQNITKSVYLPVHACDAVTDQLIECLDDLGWTPDAEEKELDSEPLSPGGVDE